ncbi:MAG: DUF424 domain-containing protein [Candidatus Aenigmatarchaeota archaeon]
MKVSYRIYDQGEDVLLAACDEELLGRTLEDEDIQLKVKKDFYGGSMIDVTKRSDEERLHKQFKRSTVANLVGENVIDTATELGFGSEEDIMWIEGVPHLQIVRL